MLDIFETKTPGDRLFDVICKLEDLFYHGKHHTVYEQIFINSWSSSYLQDNNVMVGGFRKVWRGFIQEFSL